MRLKKTSMALLIITVALAAQQVVRADSGPEVKHYSIKQTSPSVGTHLTKEIVQAGTIPLNKPYDELSAEQKQTLKDEYENLPAGDEPPFPVKGLYPIYKAIGTAHENLELQYKGSLTMYVLVDSLGNPKSVDVRNSPDEAITNAAVFALMHQKYKPAICAGQPCAMQFPLHAELVGPDQETMKNFQNPSLILSH